MKFIHSFWSKPFYDQANKDDYRFRYFGGFPEAFLFYAAWTYSCLSIKKYYPNLHLVTDDRGIHLFRDILELPYESFSNDLNALDHYPESLWALGKIHTYRSQTEPFCHIDGDVFFFGNVLDRIIEAPVFCQSFDHHEELYQVIHNDVHENFENVPKEFEADLSENIRLINAGVIGGHDLDFYQYYCEKAFQLVDNNLDKLDQKSRVNLNLYFEQFLLSNLVHKNQYDIAFLFPELLPSEHSLTRFHRVPDQSQYVHLASTLKRFTEFMEQVVIRLQLEFPEYYERLTKNYKLL
jgi:hypothetical protein